MNQAIEAWKEVPGDLEDGVLPHPQSSSSTKGKCIILICTVECDVPFLPNLLMPVLNLNYLQNDNRIILFVFENLLSAKIARSTISFD